MNLSEADDTRMRMTDLDARGSVAVLTEVGRQRLLGACPDPLAGARRRVMDQLDPALVQRPAGELQAVAEPLASRCRRTGPDRTL